MYMYIYIFIFLNYIVVNVCNVCVPEFETDHEGVWGCIRYGILHTLNVCNRLLARFLTYAINKFKKAVACTGRMGYVTRTREGQDITGNGQTAQRLPSSCSLSRTGLG